MPNSLYQPNLQALWARLQRRQAQVWLHMWTVCCQLLVGELCCNVSDNRRNAAFAAGLWAAAAPTTAARPTCLLFCMCACLAYFPQATHLSSFVRVVLLQSALLTSVSGYMRASWLPQR